MLPVFLVNTTMETYFQKGTEPTGTLEQDDRLPAASLVPGKSIDNTVVTGTESCHYSAGIADGFKKDAQEHDQMCMAIRCLFMERTGTSERWPTATLAGCCRLRLRR
jgi:hypothetical protein